MSLDRSGPFDVFLADLERVAAESAAQDVSGGTLGCGGLIGELVNHMLHSGFTWVVRKKLVAWAGSPHAWLAIGAPAGLCDLAGVSLANALDLGGAAMTSGVPPGRFARLMLAGFSESVTGDQGGERGLKGFATGVTSFMNDGIAQRALPRYRQLLLAAYAQVLAAGRADKQSVEAATRRYVRAALNDIGRVLAPPGHPFVGKPLGAVIQSTAWEADVRSRRAPLPSRDGMRGLRHRYDTMLGLA